MFGGAYGNLQATNAILDYARTNGFHPDQIIFTGDLVAYCAQPQETTDLIRQSGCHIIMGNCEESLGSGRDDCGCGFEVDTECNVLSAQWFSYCQKALSDETKQWMGTLPRHLTVEIGTFSFVCTHGTPEVINQFVFPSDVQNGDYQFPKNTNVDGYLVGHSGLPFIEENGNVLWINSGAAGMPANDGSPRIWFATIETDGNTLTAQTHSLEYDYEDAADAMTEVGLLNGYRDCLSTGIWPSHDVLPKRELDLTGSEIRSQKKVLKRTPLSKVV